MLPNKVINQTIPLNKGLNMFEASAGTGKTFNVSFLFLRLHLEKKIPLRHICAITFTKLATLELRQRINEAFKQLRDGLGIVIAQTHKFQRERNLDATLIRGVFKSSLISDWLEQTFSIKDYPVLLKQCDLALLNIHHAKISTIHSFCMDLLNRFHIQANVAGNIELTNAQQWKKLFEGFAYGFWLAQTEVDDKDSIMPVFDQLNKKQVFTILYPTPQSLIKSVPSSSIGRAVVNLSDEIEWPYVLALLLELKHSKSKRSKEYLRVESMVTHYFKNLFLQFLIQKTQSLTEQGKFNHNLIISKTLEASENNDFCELVRDEVKAIFIDEFQDTDYSQWNIIERLFLRKTGSSFVYLIGDPKQSIYSFRSADIECYFAAKDQVNEQQFFSLQTNWRSDK